MKGMAARAQVVLHSATYHRLVGQGIDVVIHRSTGIPVPPVSCPIVNIDAIPDDEETLDKMLTVLRDMIDRAVEIRPAAIIQALKELGATIERGK